MQSIELQQDLLLARPRWPPQQPRARCIDLGLDVVNTGQSELKVHSAVDRPFGAGAASKQGVECCQLKPPETGFQGQPLTPVATPFHAQVALTPPQPTVLIDLDLIAREPQRERSC